MQEKATGTRDSDSETLANPSGKAAIKAAGRIGVGSSGDVIIQPSPPLTLQEFADSLADVYAELAALSLDHEPSLGEGISI